MVEGRSVLAGVGAVVAAVFGFSMAAERNADGEVTEAGSVGAFEIRVGDCFNDEAFESTEISEIRAVPCTDAHDNQVYAAYDLTGEWPGDDRIVELAYEGLRFTRFVCQDMSSLWMQSLGCQIKN